MTTLSFDESNIKVLLLEGVHPVAAQLFQQAGYSQVECLKTALPEAELKAKLADVRVVGLRSRTQLNQAVLQAAPKLMATGCFCIGTNQVDLQQAQAQGVPVFNAPFANTRSVAEMVLAQAILLLRRIPERNMQMHRGEWKKSAEQSYETRGKVLGIIGYGHIGMQLGILAENLGMQVKFYDIAHKLPLGNAESMPSLEALLSVSDIVSLHVPATDLTRNMMRVEQIQQIKPGSILINASRGNVVDIDALAAALHNGHLQGAAVDVYPVEPKSNQDPFVSPLKGIDQVMLTPHIGGSTQEAQETIGAEVAEKLIKYMDNGTTISSVNFPKVALPSHEGRCRYLHIHHNQPGVMNAINQIFSASGANIAGQYLQTYGDLGYVVLDIDQAVTENFISALQAVPGTVRARVLF